MYCVSQELLDPGPQDSPKALSASTEELIDAQLVSSQKDTYVLEVGYRNNNNSHPLFRFQRKQSTYLKYHAVDEKC